MANRPNQLAGLAALGALGYIMSRDKKNEAPVETRSFSPNPAPSAAPAAERSAPMARMVDNGDDRDVGGGFNPAGLRRNMETGEMYDPGTVPSRAVTSRVNRSTVTPAALTPLAPERGSLRGPSAAQLQEYESSRYPDESRRGRMASAQEGAAPRAAQVPRAARTDNRPDLSTPEGQRRAEQEQALERVYPEQALLAPGIKGVAALAKSLANRTPRLAEMTMQALPAPTARLTGPSAASIKEAERTARAATRQAEMAEGNAANYGLNPNAPGYEAAAKAMRDRLGGNAFTVKKKGGVIKAKKMASGGMTVSKASSRADGIAQRGKTRGKLC